MRRAAIVAALAVLLTGAVALFFRHDGPAPAAANLPAASTTAAPPIFGVNMSLYTAGDELATSAGTQALLRTWGVPLIRVPLRSGLSDAALTQAMQAVLAVGATPMLILPGPASPPAGNQHLLSLITNVFGARKVYLEYGNEADLAGIDAAAYTAGWNRDVPALKRAAPAGYAFVGPVSFQADAGYAATFAAGARPAPDDLSWHEYVCNGGHPDAYCTGHVANWTAHANAVEAAVKAAVGHTIPFFISEWNLDPQAEARYGNPAFIGAWTRSALSELLDLTSLGLAGAMIYTATDHGTFGLIDHGALTPQGTVFRDLLTVATSAAPGLPPSLSPSGTAPSSSTGVPPAPAPAPAGSRGAGNGGGNGGGGGGGAPPPPPPQRGTVHVGFEDGLDGWGQYWGNDKFHLFTTDGAHWDGGRSLKMWMQDGSTGGYMAAGTQTGVGNLRAGDRITFHVWNSGKGPGTIRPFVMDTGYGVHFPQNESALPGSAGWLTVTFAVPAGISVHAIGLQFHSTVTNNWVALDGLTWPG
jgi:hypothetical protein